MENKEQILMNLMQELSSNYLQGLVNDYESEETHFNDLDEAIKSFDTARTKLAEISFKEQRESHNKMMEHLDSAEGKADIKEFFDNLQKKKDEEDELHLNLHLVNNNMSDDDFKNYVLNSIKFQESKGAYVPLIVSMENILAVMIKHGMPLPLDEENPFETERARYRQFTTSVMQGQGTIQKIILDGEVIFCSN